jgi:cell division transport system permease protein
MGMTEKGPTAIPIKEVEFSFNSTFLTDYWQEGFELPLESGFTTFFTVLSRTRRVFLSEPLSSLSSYVIVSSSLLMLTLFLLFDYNIARLLSQVGPSNEGMLYFKAGAVQEEMHNVHKILVESDFIGFTNFISKEQALALFKEDFGSDSALLKGLEENPLPNAIEFSIKEEFKTDQAISILEKDIKPLNVVDEVTIGAPWADAAERFRQGLQTMSLTVFIIVLGVVMFIVANAVKLMLFSQKEEIDIMQLVGAPRILMLSPYLLTGMVQGFLGGLTALGICYVLFISFLEPLNSSLVLGISYDAFTFLGFGYVVLVLFTGVFLGVGGSALALRKWTE